MSRRRQQQPTVAVPFRPLRPVAVRPAPAVLPFIIMLRQHITPPLPIIMPIPRRRPVPFPVPAWEQEEDGPPLFNINNNTMRLLWKNNHKSGRPLPSFSVLVPVLEEAVPSPPWFPRRHDPPRITTDRELRRHRPRALYHPQPRHSRLDPCPILVHLRSSAVRPWAVTAITAAAVMV